MSRRRPSSPVTAAALEFVLMLSVALALTPGAAVAQSDRAVVQVTDVRGNAIPFAWVSITNGVSRIADDSGRATFNVKNRDSLNIQARRVGFQPFIGWVKRDTLKDQFLADLVPLPQTLDPVNIKGRRDTPLARTGFYDRVERVQKGAYSARMITPEELEFRNPLRLTQVFAGESMVKVTPRNGKQVLMGRGFNCAMTILLDGQKLVGTLEEGVGNPGGPPESALSAVDDIITAQSVAAIEVYGSIAAVPAELQRAAGSRMAQGCGLIAIWTGSRR